ncbi:MAG: hypothetical protein H0V24_10995 [Chloroflexia bacterium]|nr:hypothetical protein [Chloroflexia bacterium]
MSEGPLVLSHRQLVSGLISLIMGGDQAVSPILGNLGYVLDGLEIPMVDPTGNRFVPDILVTRSDINLSLLIECKSGPDSVEEQQVSSYLTMQGLEVVRQGRLTVASSSSHRVDAVFFVLSAAELLVRSAVDAVLALSKMKANGLGLIRVNQDRTSIQLDQLSDASLSASLREGWNIRFTDLPLERLPYEPSSPDWDLAQSLLQTLKVFFLERRSSFSVEDVCRDSNGLWAYLPDQHDLLRRRVRKMIDNLRGTAFKGWFARVAGTTDQWRFTRRSTANTNVQIAFQRREYKYITLLKEHKIPTPTDFADIDQLPLPLTTFGDDEGFR